MFYDFITKYIDILLKKTWEKLLTDFQQKSWHISHIDIWNFNETLTNNVVSLEQPGPG